MNDLKFNFLHMPSMAGLLIWILNLCHQFIKFNVIMLIYFFVILNIEEVSYFGPIEIFKGTFFCT